MDYERRYKEALKWMQGLYGGLHGVTKEEAEHYFPELKESEDDRIVRCLLNYFNHVRYNGLDLKGTDVNEVIAWLEKQEEKVTNINGEDYGIDALYHAIKILERTVGRVTGYQSDDGILEHKVAINAVKELYKKQSENKPADKTTPKFKVGDWIVINETTYQITEIDNYHVVLSLKGKECNFGLDVPNNAHLWTINDAKDGDVLVDAGNNIGIYKEIEGLCWHSYIYLGCDNLLRGFRIGGSHIQNNTKPATKKQRDLLFQKMKEAGYEWDSEKKEFKKIEPKKLNPDNVIAWLVANICDFEYYVKLFKKDFGL